MPTSMHDETAHKHELLSRTDSSPDDKERETDSILEDMDNLPTEARQLVEKMVVQFGMMGVGRASQENEVAKKINETHITKYLDGAQEQMQKDYQEQHERKIFTVVLVVLALTFFIIIIILLKESPDILEKIIYSVVGLVAGAFGGYGFGRQKNRNDD